MPIRRLLICALLLLASNLTQAEESLPIYNQWGGDFTLTDQYGLQISLSDLRGKIILLTFGYTHCPDICPNTLLTIKSAINRLGDQAERVQVVFITLDPQRDYPERLKTFVEFFNPAFIALTGNEESIAKVAKKYGMKYEKEFFDSTLEYGIAHSTIIYLIDQQSRIRAFYKLSAPASRIEQDIRRLLQTENTHG